MADSSYKRLLLRARNDRGLDLSGYKEAFILRRLRSRFRALGIDDLEAYCNILKHQPDEYKKLLEALAINVTEFFRDPSLFDLISRNVMQEIVKKKMKDSTKSLRILCAGGASGEEAYSVAILLCETLGRSLSGFTVSIQSFDIDEDCIKKTRNGMYTKERLRNVSRKLLDHYFTREGDIYKVKPLIKNLVRSYQMDLITDRIPKYFDIIFCRNVLIYFSKEMHSEIFLKFHASLKDEGFLILGRTETLIGIGKGLFNIYDAKERIYRKHSNSRLSE